MLLVAAGSSPSHQAAEEVWRLEIVEPHVEKLVELIGPRARELVVLEEFTVTDTTWKGSGIYEVSYRFDQRLTQELEEIHHIKPGPLELMRNMFPAGKADETSSRSGIMKLKDTDTGWSLAN